MSDIDIDIDIQSEITTVYCYFNDIIHLHIYPFIFFMIYNNISNYYFIKFIRNMSLIVLLHILFFSFSKKYLLPEQSTIELRLYNSIIYIILVEFIAYAYHRLSHSEYGINHSINIGSSYEYLLRSKYDIIATFSYIYFPIFLVPITYSDFIIIYYHYIFIGFLSNTIVFFKIHNATKKYNYSLGIPIFDIIFGTYLSEQKYELINISNR